MATIETKYVDVGFFDGGSKFPDQYGFSSPITIGTLSDTANGTSNPDVSGIYSSVDATQVVWFDTNILQFAVEGVRSNSGWDSMTVGSTTVNRSDASFTTSSAGNGSSSWNWSSQSNPFGTTTGADVLVTWDDGVTSDTTPDTFNFTDVPNADTSTEYNTYVQITGINASTTVSRTSGSGTFAVSSSTTTPTSGFGTTGSITNNQYLHVKQTSSSSLSTPVSTTISVGGVSDAWVVTTKSTNLSVSLAATDITRQGEVEGYELTPTASNATGTVTYAFTGTMSSRSASGIGPNLGNTLRIGGEWGTSQWYVVATDDNGSAQSSTITLDTTPPWFYTGSMGLERLGGGSTTVEITDTNTAISFTVTTSTGWESNMRYFTKYALIETGTNNELGATTQGVPGSSPEPTWTDPYSKITIPTGSLPAGGETLSMHLEAFLAEADGGGTGGTWVDLSETITASIENTSGPDVTVTFSVSYDDEFGTYDITISPSGTIELNHSDVVRFIYIENAFFPPVGTHTLTVQAFDTGEWTNTSSFILNDGDSSDKTRPASGISPGTTDVVSFILKNSSNTTVATRSVTFVQTYNLPDTSVTFSDVTMAENDTSYTVTIGARTGEGDAYASSTVYTLYQTDTPSGLLGTRTGHGDIPVTTDTPPFLGVPIERYIYCKLPTASGGSDSYVPVEDADGSNAVEITRGDAPGINPPSIPGEELYGLAIYDNEENLVTFFTENHTVLRPLLQESITTSTSSTTTLSTGIPELSTDNSMVYITGSSSGSGGGVEYAKNIPATIDANGDVIVARTSTAQNLNVEVVQYLGETLGSERPEFGIEIRNQNDNVVMDNLASAYAVKEIIPLFNSSTTYNGHTITVYNQYVGATYVFIQLAPNRYPTTGGIPIVGISKSTSIQGTLIPPRVSGVSSNANGSYYSSLYVTIPKRGPIAQTAVDISSWSIAMLVDRTSTEPVYYGGQPSDFGFKVYSDTGEVQFDSAWRQAIVTNIVDVNVFTTGTNQNGSYDVTTGYDGVTGPPEFASGIAAIAGRSTGQSITVSDLNVMDPSNTYVLGNFCSGQVVYYQTDILNRIDEYEEGGGGYHVPAVTSINNYSAVITMKWYSGGPSYSQVSATPGSRHPASTHPEGQLVFVRIT
jgi:hypothetical protein